MAPPSNDHADVHMSAPDDHTATATPAATPASTIATASGATPSTADDPKPLALKVRTLDQSTYPITVGSNATVEQLKELVAIATGVVFARQRLIFRGKVLKNDQRIAAYALEDGHTLHLVVRAEAAVVASTNNDTSANATTSDTSSNASAPRDAATTAAAATSSSNSAVRNNDEPDPSLTGGNANGGNHVVMGATIALADGANVSMPFLSSMIANIMSSAHDAGVPGHIVISDADPTVRDPQRASYAHFTTRPGPTASALARTARRSRTDPSVRVRTSGSSTGGARGGATSSMATGLANLRARSEMLLETIRSNVENFEHDFEDYDELQLPQSATNATDAAFIQTQLTQLEILLDHFRSRLHLLPVALHDLERVDAVVTAAAGASSDRPTLPPMRVVVRTIDTLQSIGEAVDTLARMARFLFIRYSPSTTSRRPRVTTTTSADSSSHNSERPLRATATLVRSDSPDTAVRSTTTGVAVDVLERTASERRAARARRDVTQQLLATAQRRRADALAASNASLQREARVIRATSDAIDRSASMITTDAAAIDNAIDAATAAVDMLERASNERRAARARLEANVRAEHAYYNNDNDNNDSNNNDSSSSSAAMTTEGSTSTSSSGSTLLSLLEGLHASIRNFRGVLGSRSTTTAAASAASVVDASATAAAATAVDTVESTTPALAAPADASTTARLLPLPTVVFPIVITDVQPNAPTNATWNFSAMLQHLANDVPFAMALGVVHGDATALQDVLSRIGIALVSGRDVPAVTRATIRPWSHALVAEVRQQLRSTGLPTAALALLPREQHARVVDQLVRPLEPFGPDLVDFVLRATSASRTAAFAASTSAFLTTMARQFVRHVRAFVGGDDATLERLLTSLLVHWGLDARLAAFAVASLLDAAAAGDAGQRRVRDGDSAQAMVDDDEASGPANKRRRET